MGCHLAHLGTFASRMGCQGPSGDFASGLRSLHGALRGFGSRTLNLLSWKFSSCFAQNFKSNFYLKILRQYIFLQDGHANIHCIYNYNSWCCRNSIYLMRLLPFFLKYIYLLNLWGAQFSVTFLDWGLYCTHYGVCLGLAGLVLLLLFYFTQYWCPLN